MSYDLTIKADDEYSVFVVLERVSEFLTKLPRVHPTGPGQFLLDDLPNRWMEIDLEVVSPEGSTECVSDHDLGRANCIRLHIPYAYLGEAPERDYFPMAADIAGFLEWRLYDEQTGEDIA